MLIGEAKKKYQREYMRRKRAKLKLYSKLNSNFVRPKTSIPVRPNIDADGNIYYEE